MAWWRRTPSAGTISLVVSPSSSLRHKNKLVALLEEGEGLHFLAGPTEG